MDESFRLHQNRGCGISTKGKTTSGCYTLGPGNARSARPTRQLSNSGCTATGGLPVVSGLFESDSSVFSSPAPCRIRPCRVRPGTAGPARATRRAPRCSVMIHCRSGARSRAAATAARMPCIISPENSRWGCTTIRSNGMEAAICSPSSSVGRAIATKQVSSQLAGSRSQRKRANRANSAFASASVLPRPTINSRVLPAGFHGRPLPILTEACPPRGRWPRRSGGLTARQCPGDKRAPEPAKPPEPDVVLRP